MTATIYTSGLNILAHSGLTFRSANEVIHHLSKKEAAIIRSQPGYQRGEVMTVRFVDGGVRLYTRVGHDWMDASLQTVSV